VKNNARRAEVRGPTRSDAVEGLTFCFFFGGGVAGAKFSFNFRHESLSSRHSFETEQYIQNLKEIQVPNPYKRAKNMC